MGVKNIEKNIFDRIITQIKGIDGSGNYNFNILNHQIHEEFMSPEKAAPDRNKPIVCFGEQRIGMAIGERRGEFKLPYSLEIWGYTKNSADQMGELNKLISDIRIAIAGAEHLNDLVTNLEFQVSSGIDTLTHKGVVIFSLTAKAYYDTDA